MITGAYSLLRIRAYIKYDFLDEITEIRTSCGFRENMIREANRPFDEVDF